VAVDIAAILAVLDPVGHSDPLHSHNAAGSVPGSPGGRRWRGSPRRLLAARVWRPGRRGGDRGGRRDEAPPYGPPGRPGKEAGVEAPSIDVNRTFGNSSVLAGPRLRHLEGGAALIGGENPSLAHRPAVFVRAPPWSQARPGCSGRCPRGRVYVDRPLQPPGTGGFRRTPCPSRHADPFNRWHEGCPVRAVTVVGHPRQLLEREQAVRAISMEVQSSPKGVGGYEWVAPGHGRTVVLYMRPVILSGSHRAGFNLPLGPHRRVETRPTIRGDQTGSAGACIDALFDLARFDVREWPRRMPNAWSTKSMSPWYTWGSL